MKETWKRKMMDEALHTASRSKDRSTKTGAVFFDLEDYSILQTGYNGFPRRVYDSGQDYLEHKAWLEAPETLRARAVQIEARHDRPAKYLWTVHAEANAICTAAKYGIPLNGCGVAMPWYPCSRCAGELIQVGVKYVLCVRPNFDDPKYGPDFQMVNEMFQEVGMFVEFIPKKSRPSRLRTALKT